MMTSQHQNLKPIVDRLNRGTCPIVCEASIVDGGLGLYNRRYRVESVSDVHGVRLYDLSRQGELMFPAGAFAARLADGRILLEG